MGLVFARLDGQALVSHVLQRHHFGANLVLGKLAARDGAVLGVIWAIQAAVHAIVGKVERREQHDAVAVVGQLYLARQALYLLVYPRVLAGQQHGSLAVRYHRAVLVGGVQMRAALLQDLPAKLQVVLVLLGVCQRFHYLVVVDELVGARRFRVVCVLGHGPSAPRFTARKIAACTARFPASFSSCSAPPSRALLMPAFRLLAARWETPACRMKPRFARGPGAGRRGPPRARSRWPACVRPSRRDTRPLPPPC